MLYVRELHEVKGREMAAFEAEFRGGFLPALARDDDARLLYFLHHAHGTGPSFNVVTITAVRNGAALERLMGRIDGGDLAPWAERVDDLRHDVTAKILRPLPWSPLDKIDLSTVPTDGGEGDSALYMEDTVWPFEGRLEDYVERSGTHYVSEMSQHERAGTSLLEVQAGFRTAFGAGRRREVVLWQKVIRPKGLVPLITSEVPEKYNKPGSWMYDALAVRDRWQSRLLRTVEWSPLA